MTEPLPRSARMAPTNRPAGRAIGYQRWRDLTFLHWTVPVEAVQKTLPEGVVADTFEGRAYIGLVPFLMRGVRPWWSPAVPGVSNFLETNVRTYVVVNGEPGVWFYSLDASSSLAVRIARRVWNLPYFRSTMEFERTETTRRYTCDRRWPDPSDARSDVTIELDPTAEPQPGSESSLEEFLAERYLLFTQKRSGELLRGQVYHTPYPLLSARCTGYDDELARVAGFDIEPKTPPVHIAFSPGVDVEIFPLTTI